MSSEGHTERPVSRRHADDLSDMRYLPLILLAVIGAVILNACGDDAEDTAGVGEPVTVTVWSVPSQDVDWYQRFATRSQVDSPWQSLHQTNCGPLQTELGTTCAQHVAALLAARECDAGQVWDFGSGSCQPFELPDVDPGDALDLASEALDKAQKALEAILNRDDVPDADIDRAYNRWLQTQTDPVFWVNPDASSTRLHSVRTITSTIDTVDTASARALRSAIRAIN